MIWPSMSTKIANAAAAIHETFIVGTSKRSRSRDNVAPRRRSWGSTNKTTNKLITGIETPNAGDHVPHACGA